MDEFEKHLHKIQTVSSGATLDSMPAYVGMTLFLNDGECISLNMEESEYHEIRKKYGHFFE